MGKLNRPVGRRDALCSKRLRRNLVRWRVADETAVTPFDWCSARVRNLSISLFGCKKTAEKIIGTDVNGVAADNRGQPVAGATVRLYNLLDNTEFVHDTDILSAEAYINREAVLASNNTERSVQTRADGRFTMDGVLPNAFLAVAVAPGCSAGFAGFNEETGVLNWDTLIKPSFDDGVHFDIPEFVLACAAPPEVGPEGNSNEAPSFDPPKPAVTCDPATCAAAGGTCHSDTCVITCSASVCAASGGTCDGGTCVAPACNPTACSTTGGTCNQDSVSCPPVMRRRAPQRAVPASEMSAGCPRAIRRNARRLAVAAARTAGPASFRRATRPRAPHPAAAAAQTGAPV